ncbi:DUF1492 domain-containing protein [Anaeromassilibacillus sp. An200]|mgnify:FL=1|uniref:DUF1492 domain-containing protein n=1 Tax=Anaeromassilibacillus sp. An200 TaxID=1965587 RepID=UPI001FA88022|nr:DUF1492 domain-containing protein [Anaeromassilibacillus sp. An200]
MTDFQQEKLRRYLLARDRLQRKCEEVNRWKGIRAELTALGGARPDGRSRSGGGQDTLLELREELERAALETRELRRELQKALAQMPDGDLRGLLEDRYLVGRSKRELMEHYCLSERSYYRRLTQAARCLDRCSTFFRAPS